MSSYRRRKQLMAQMNVVPYIDVMLVLLIIFMVTSPMLSLTQGVEVNLPQASSESIPESKVTPLIISLSKDAEISLHYDNQTEQAISQEILAARALALLQLNPERSVLLRADESVPHGQVVQLMASLQRAGVKKVGIMTKSPNESASPAPAAQPSEQPQTPAQDATGKSS